MRKPSYAGMVNVDGVPLYVSDASRLFGKPERTEEKRQKRYNLQLSVERPKMLPLEVRKKKQIQGDNILYKPDYMPAAKPVIQPVIVEQDTANVAKAPVYIPAKNSAATKPEAKEVIVEQEAKPSAKQYQGKDVYTPKDSSTFNKAFAEARKNGAEVFEFKGKIYGTQVAGATTQKKLNTDYRPEPVQVKTLAVETKRPMIYTGRPQDNTIREMEQFKYNMPVMKNGNKIYYMPK